MQKNQNNELYDKIIEKLKTVYDPEFPLVDMYTLGLIYGVELKIEEKICDLTMTFTTPTCPMADMIMEMVKNAVLDGEIPYTFEAADAFMREKAAELGLQARD